MMDVGDVVKLTEYGRSIFAREFYDRDDIPPIGSTAVIKALLYDEPGTNPEMVIEFFAYPGDEWGCFEGEIERVNRR